jgi:hypothetical protein
MPKFNSLAYSSEVSLERNVLIRELKDRILKFPFLKRIRNDDYTFSVISDVGDFTYTVSHPTVVMNGRGSVFNYECHFFPKAGIVGKLITGSMNLDKAEVLKRFDEWCIYVSKIVSAPNGDDEDLNQLQTEVEQIWFMPGEELSDTEVFSSQTQTSMLQVLERLRLPLATVQDDDEAAEIVSDIKELETNLPDLPQKDAAREFDTIFGKFKKWCGKRIDELVDVGKKEMYKRILTGDIVHDVRRLIDYIHTF